MNGLDHLLALLTACALCAPAAGAGRIEAARYEHPVDRYGHFAAGRPHEYSRLEALTDDGVRHTLDLPEDEVFEDVQPRLVRLAPDQAVEILTIVSESQGGARLVLIGLEQGRLQVSAQSRPIGTPMRWLNPVGVADLDGDGKAEIAAVITPHIGGILKIYRRVGGELREIAALGGFSNHVYGSTELGLSAVLSTDGHPRLLVPDARRQQLRVVGMTGGRLVELGRCALRGSVTGTVSIVSPTEITAVTSAGRQTVAPADCR